MKKYIYNTVALVTFFILIPAITSAATVYIETAQNKISVGDTAILNVKINAEGATINTVEGTVSLKSLGGNLVVKEFSLANSAFGLWPRTPSLSNDGKTISFVGGVPGGFSIEGATLFKIIVEAQKEGAVTLVPESLNAFANDGEGTKVSIKGVNLPVTVISAQKGVQPTNEWQKVIGGDKTAPEDFIIVLGQDSSLFEGKKFAFFSALDNQSGVDHYDVSENGAPAVRSGSTYVLQDQSGQVKLDVIAYDKAGNKKSSTYSGTGSETQSGGKGISWVTIVSIVVALYIIRKIYKKMKGGKKHAS
jgi:hypothetical protein